MHYSSGLFRDPDYRIESLERAQQRKVDAILDRLDLGEGDSLLEIGCGWGGLAEQAMARCPIRYDGLTLSVEPAHYARDRLGSGANIILQDYREATGPNYTLPRVEVERKNAR